ASVAVEVNPALASSVIALPNPSTVGSSVGLVAQVSGGTAPYSYHWALGDSSSATTASVTHAYSRAGNYSVTLNVTDALGTSVSSSTTVAVNRNATTGAPPASSGSSSVSLTSGTGLYLLLGILLLGIVVVALAVMLARRPKSPPGPPAAYATGPGGVPPAAGQGAGPPPSAGA
ncbi:MAG: PKD domain-containing protein, partial [Thermoplasmata archaeon]|nr:PKD domain-containing protein [Thermoplasmata archaeon]